MADGLSMNLAGMSKNQLYDIMSQMKTLIEQNQDQARQILIQNPPLTKALFQAQIMLGMLHPPQETPKTQPDGPPHPHQPTPPAPLPNPQNPPLPAQQPTPLLPLQPVQHNRTNHINAQLPPPMLSPQSSNMAPQYSTQPPPSVIQPTLPPVTTPLQPPMHISSTSHLPLQPPLQPPLPPQPRPPSMPPTFPHQSYPHMGPGAGFQHQGASQLHHSQPAFHSASRPPTSMSTPFSQGQPPLPNQQQPSQTLYQGGGSHVGMDFNQMGIQPERGSNWMPEGPSPPPFLPPHMSSASQPPRPASLTADMEKALLQQVMSLTPEQINMLPPDQRNQVLQLQKMLRQ